MVVNFTLALINAGLAGIWIASGFSGAAAISGAGAGFCFALGLVMSRES